MKLRSPSIDMPSSDEMAIMNTPGFNPSSVLQSPVFPPPSNARKSSASAGTRRPVPPQSLSERRSGGSSRPTVSSAATLATPHTAPISTLPSALSNGTMNHSTFQMDLLNKGGRIGIYLPDARRARIAKFHSKRKMRIWRKRIKYDCRKKLADSRPRVKGRFVKRSEMDDEE